MNKHRYKVGEHVAIIGGQFFGQNGRVTELLNAGDRPVYAVKVLTGPYCNVPGSIVIAEPYCRTLFEAPNKMSHEQMKLNRHEKFDEDETEIVVRFKYHAGVISRSMYYKDCPPDSEPEIEILKIETLTGADITDLISEAEYQYIEDFLYDSWEDTSADEIADYVYESRKDLE